MFVDSDIDNRNIFFIIDLDILDMNICRRWKVLFTKICHLLVKLVIVLDQSLITGI